MVIHRECKMVNIKRKKKKMVMVVVLLLFETELFKVAEANTVGAVVCCCRPLASLGMQLECELREL